MQTRHWHIPLAVLVVAGSLVGGLVVAVRAQSVDGVVARPQLSAPLTSAPVSAGPGTGGAPPTARRSGTTSPPTPMMLPGPPAGTVHSADRYRARYDGRHLGWDDLIDEGRKLPRATAGCRSDWRDTTKDAALSWDKAGYLCLDRLTGKGFKPQGVAGSGATEGYPISGEPADWRDIVLVSSYSTVPEKGLRFPHTPGTTEATRLTAIDLGRGRYNQVELVKPVGSSELVALDSHGSGLVWAGQYLYSSSRGSLWMYNADDLMEIDGRYVLPAVAHWSVKGAGGLSSIGIDRSTSPTSLIGINYTERGTGWAQTFELDADGRPRPGATEAEHELTLVSSFGPGPAVVRSTRSTVVPGTNFQGIGTSGPYRFVNSSSLLLDGRRHGDNVVILKKNKIIGRFAMPRENIESLYLDHRRSRYVTVTEHGRQFLFWLPTDHLIESAER